MAALQASLRQLASRATFLVASSLTISGCGLTEPAVSLGGVSLGMDMDAYTQIASTHPGFELEGVYSTDTAPQATFVDGKLTSFQWRFPAKQYERVRDALAARYPRMRCRKQADAREICTIGRTFSLSQGPRAGFHSNVHLHK